MVSSVVLSSWRDNAGSCDTEKRLCYCFLLAVIVINFSWRRRAIPVLWNIPEIPAKTTVSLTAFVRLAYPCSTRSDILLLLLLPAGVALGSTSQFPSISGDDVPVYCNLNLPQSSMICIFHVLIGQEVHRIFDWLSASCCSEQQRRHVAILH